MLVELELGPLAVCPGLREIDCGGVDGAPIDRVEKDHPELWSRNLRQDDVDFRWPGGESYREFRARCVDAIRAMAGARAPGDRVAAVTHAGVISQIIGSITGRSAARSFTKQR